MQAAGLVMEQRELDEVEVYAKLLAMTVVGLEEAVGPSAAGVVNLVSKKLYELMRPDTSSPRSFLEWVNRSCALKLNTYRVRGRLVREEQGGRAFYLIAYECPIRQVLYLEDLPGGRSLCRIVCGFLGLGLSESLGSRVRVEPSRIGPNACLIRAGLGDGAEAMEKVDVVSEKPSMEEYREKLLETYRRLLGAVGWALYRVLGANPAMSYRAGKNYGRMNGALLLAEGFEAESLEEAVELFNRGLGGMVRVELRDGLLAIVESQFDRIIEEAGVEHPEFIDRILQGFVAGVLEVLTGRSLDLRSTSEKRVYRVVVRGG